MKNNFGLIINMFLITISFSQAPCILGEVYVSEAANKGDPDDYIEVYNGGGEECTLAGFQLDDSEALEDFTFGNVLLAPGNYWYGYEDAEDSFTSGLSAEGDNIFFADADGNILIVILAASIQTADGVELSQSYESNGEGCYTMPTPGEPNVDCFFNCPPGDLNCDGSWDIMDVILLVHCVLGQYCTELLNDDAGDLDNNEVFNIMDVVSLVNCILVADCGERADDPDTWGCFQN